MKSKLLILALIPLFALGCNDLFDTGDAEKVWDGLQLGFFPLQQEVSLEDDDVATVEVQLIGAHQDSDVNVSFSVSGESTAVAGEHYNLVTSSPVTLSSGTSTVDIVVELIDESVESGSVRLILDLADSDGIESAANLNRSTIIIAP